VFGVVVVIILNVVVVDFLVVEVEVVIGLMVVDVDIEVDLEVAAVEDVGVLDWLFVVGTAAVDVEILAVVVYDDVAEIGEIVSSDCKLDAVISRMVM
jgi:hypothetical protein